MSIQVPVDDVSPLVRAGPGQAAVGEALGQACRERGFFYVEGHGVPVPLQEQLEVESRAFLALDVAQRMEIQVARAPVSLYD